MDNFIKSFEKCAAAVSALRKYPWKTTITKAKDATEKAIKSKKKVDPRIARLKHLRSQITQRHYTDIK